MVLRKKMLVVTCAVVLALGVGGVASAHLLSGHSGTNPPVVRVGDDDQGDDEQGDQGDDEQGDSGNDRGDDGE